MKKKASGPRRKRMKRSARLQSARSTDWVARYPGNNIILGYSRWFGVDLLCAVGELRELGVTISRQREQQIRQSISDQNTAKQQQTQAQTKKRQHWDSDDTFAFIAGYTSGGAAYGITWQELNEASERADGDGEIDLGESDRVIELPF